MANKEFAGMLKTVMELSGEKFEIIHDGERKVVIGARNKQKATNRRYVQFYPGTDVKEGDTLIQIISGENWLVVEVDHKVLRGELFSINAYYQTNNDRNLASEAHTSYTFNNSSNIIAGNQRNALIISTTDEIKQMIDEKGGTEKESLYDLVETIKETFEKKETISKGSLMKFSETLEKHSWITGSLIQLIGSAAIQFLIK